jgi:hypothetical protein
VGPAASAAIIGPGLGLLPSGEPGTVAVVLAGPYVFELGTHIPFVLRNTTAEPVTELVVTASAYEADGTLIHTAQAGPIQIQPWVVPPGGYAIGTVGFGTLRLAKAVRFAFAVEWAVGISAAPYYDLEIARASFDGDRIAGKVRNHLDRPVTFYTSVMYACLSPDGGLRYVATVYTEAKSIEPGATAPFVIDEHAIGDPCALFVLAAAGYSPG